MRPITAKIFLLSLAGAFVALAFAHPVLARTRNVDCDQHQTLAKVLAKADPGDTIRIRGVCREPVVITTDRLTLEGRGNAKIDGNNVDLSPLLALVTIKGASGIVITGKLTIQNSAFIGLSVLDNAGIVFGENANFTSRNNAAHGIVIFSGSDARIDSGTVKTQDNGGDGFVVANGASAILSLAPADAFTLISKRNARGLHLANGGSFQMLGGTLRAVDNRIHGLRAAYGANLFITGRGQVFLKRNPQGLNIESNAQALISKSPAITDRTVIIRDNTVAGVSVQAGFIDLRDAKIRDNGPMDHGLDVDLGFGTRAHLTGNALDVLHCDETVLLSPDTDPEVVCPTP